MEEIQIYQILLEYGLGTTHYLAMWDNGAFFFHVVVVQKLNQGVIVKCNNKNVSAFVLMALVLENTMHKG